MYVCHVFNILMALFVLVIIFVIVMVIFFITKHMTCSNDACKNLVQWKKCFSHTHIKII